jgi:leader peptidase (prepilin peptidase)/N-methyltransferase
MLLPPEPLATALVAVAGLMLGSFLNVCIYRLPVGESVVHPRSRCPHCGTLIRWYCNIPVLSWIALRGACAACAGRISWRYPLVELLSAAACVASWRLLGPGWGFAVAAPFALALIVLFFTDLDHQLLPDAVTLTGLGCGLALAWVNPFLSGTDWGRLWTAGAGAALGSSLLWCVGELYRRLRGVEAMGLGDVKMMAMVGAFTGPAGVMFTIFAASLVGAAVGLALIPLRGGSLKDKLPFGCFLAPAAWAALFVARTALSAYAGMFQGFQG